MIFEISRQANNKKLEKAKDMIEELSREIYKDLNLKGADREAIVNKLHEVIVHIDDKLID